MFDISKILVLAPHTDDGELGCGGSIAKFCSQGINVYYAAFSLCQQSLPPGFSKDTLQQECKKATAVLGIPAKNIFFFDFEVRNFPASRQEILETMVKLNRDMEPDLVLLPSSSDIHQDHAVIHAEGLRAFKHSSLLGYELPWNQTTFHSTFLIKLSKNDLDKKAESLKAYTSQSKKNYMQEDFARSLAKVRGVQAGADYAEAFEMYKMIS